MLVIDTVTLGDQRRTTKDGYLVVDARIARTGIQLYRGSEVGRPESDIVRVYRSPEEVFSDAARASFGHKPVTLDHPPESVNSGNWSKYAKGYTSGDIAKDGDYLRVPFALMDAEAIRAVDGGKRELSNGYACELDWTPGVTPQGEAYDASQRNIRGNHLAIVDAARAGPACRIGDSFAFDETPITKDRDMPDNIRTVVVDGLSVQTTDQGAQAIEKLTRERDDARTTIATDKATHTAAIAAKDEAIGTLTADKAKLEAAAPKPADLDRMVADRVALVTTAKALVTDLKPEGLTDVDIRKAVVKAKLGDDVLKDASDDMVVGMFKALAKDVRKVDPVRDAVRGGLQTTDAGDLKTIADKARSERDKALSEAYRGVKAA